MSIKANAFTETAIARACGGRNLVPLLLPHWLPLLLPLPLPLPLLLPQWLPLLLPLPLPLPLQLPLLLMRTATIGDIARSPTHHLRWSGGKRRTLRTEQILLASSIENGFPVWNALVLDHVDDLDVRQSLCCRHEPRVLHPVGRCRGTYNCLVQLSCSAVLSSCLVQLSCPAVLSNCLVQLSCIPSQIYHVFTSLSKCYISKRFFFDCPYVFFKPCNFHKSKISKIFKFKINFHNNKTHFWCSPQCSSHSSTVGSPALASRS